MKIIKIYEDLGHVEFDCGDGVIQKNQDLFTDTADGIKVNVANYCEIYSANTKPAIPAAEITKMRAAENKTFTKAEVIG
jgi:hypothetical protein